jgi:hypothetical protein
MRSSISVDPWTGHPSVSRRNAGEAAAGLDRISEDGSSEDGGFPEFESFERPEVDPDAEPTPQRGGARGPR